MTEWINTDYDSRREYQKFAWFPVWTFDGWVWLRSYYVREVISGWGFHDYFKYKELPEWE